MGQKPGQVVGKMLWLVPRYVENRGTIMKLGSIIKDPANLESSLNLDAIPPIPLDKQRDATPHVRHYVRTELSNSNSILAKAVPDLPLFSAGVSADGRWAHDAETTVKAMNVEAQVFIPDKNYMEAALKHAAVVEYTRAGLFGKPLYIIVGVATASKLSIKESQVIEQSVAASAHVAVPGGAAEGDVGFERQRRAAVSSELEVGGACDFAYRLREFEYSRIFGTRDKGDYGQSAMFGHEEDGKRVVVQDKTEEFPHFMYLEKEDVVTPGLVILAIPNEEHV